MRKFIFVLLVILFAILGLIQYFKMLNKNYVSPKENLVITSDNFKNGEMLSVEYTGFGEDISPNLNLESIHPKGKSIAIIMDDLDTPIGLLNHWVIWNIPVKYTSITSDIGKNKIVERLDGAIQEKKKFKNLWKVIFFNTEQ